MLATLHAGAATDPPDFQPVGVAPSNDAEISVGVQLAAAVVRQLSADSIVDAHDIDVAATDSGIVTLTGNQPLLLACDQARYIAESVPGVRSVASLLNVQQLREADTQKLESDVFYVLLTDPATERGNYEVSASSLGRVTLSGTVGSHTQRYLAGQVVRNVVGVTAITNRLMVAAQPRRYNRQTLADIRHTLDWDAHVDSRGIKVVAERGAVALLGEVSTAAEKRRSIALSLNAGALDVDASQLQVTGAASTASEREQVPRTVRFDRDIAAAVRRLLLTDPRLRDADIRVVVKRGVVTLKGSVANVAAQRVAEALSNGVRGVASIDNRLHVPASAGVFADAEIESRIERSLERNSVTMDDAVSTGVVDGVVTLEGEAHNWLSRQLAENAAASVRGVSAVINEINVAEGASALAFNPYADAGWAAWAYE